MHTRKYKGWVPADESGKKTIGMIHADETVFLTRREAGLESKTMLGDKEATFKQVLITITCEDVKKEKK